MSLKNFWRTREQAKHQPVDDRRRDPYAIMDEIRMKENSQAADRTLQRIGELMANAWNKKVKP